MKNKLHAADFQPQSWSEFERPFGRGAVPNGARPRMIFEIANTPAATSSRTAVRAYGIGLLSSPLSPSKICTGATRAKSNTSGTPSSVKAPMKTIEAPAKTPGMADGLGARPAAAAKRMIRAAAILLLVLAVSAGAQQDGPPNAILLIAKPELADPNFRRAVVLVTQAADASTIGVILNRPTGAKNEKTAEPVYFGGPVMTQVTVALFRTDTVPGAAAFPVLKGIYLSMLHAFGRVKSVLRGFSTDRSAASACPSQLRVPLSDLNWRRPGNRSSRTESGCVPVLLSWYVASIEIRGCVPALKCTFISCFSMVYPGPKGAVQEQIKKETPNTDRSGLARR